MKMMTLAKAYFWQFGEVSYPFEIHDAKGNVTYYEDSGGYWEKHEYNSNGKLTYSEDSDGYWLRLEYDSNGNLTYFDGREGLIEGQKQSSTIEIDGVKYSAEQVRERIAELKPVQDK